jgi:hypothetical protein
MDDQQHFLAKPYAAELRDTPIERFELMFQF